MTQILTHGTIELHEEPQGEQHAEGNQEMEHLDDTEDTWSHDNVDNTETEEDNLEGMEEYERDEEGNLENRGDYGINSQETDTHDDNMDEIPRDSTDDQEAEASEDNVEDEAERGRYLRNGFRILKTMHRNYKKFNPGAPPT